MPTNRDSPDALYDLAVELVLSTQNGSVSHLQRRLRTGYNRTRRLFEEMELAGIVSPESPDGTRYVLRSAACASATPMTGELAPFSDEPSN